ncbi:4645_t:CDS:1, partial [Funneliformis caledonium]
LDANKRRPCSGTSPKWKKRDFHFCQVIWVTAASRPPRKSSGISPPPMAETVDKSLSKFMHEP